MSAVSLLQVARPLRGGQRQHHAVGEERGPGSAADLAAGGGHTGSTCSLATSRGEVSMQGTPRRPCGHTGGWVPPDSDSAGLGGPENLRFSPSSQLLLLLVRGPL